MVPRGLEPRTLRLLAVRSGQLSYETACMSNVGKRQATSDHCFSERNAVMAHCSSKTRVVGCANHSKYRTNRPTLPVMVGICYALRIHGSTGCANRFKYIHIRFLVRLVMYFDDFGAYEHITSPLSLYMRYRLCFAHTGAHSVCQLVEIHSNQIPNTNRFRGFADSRIRAPDQNRISENACPIHVFAFIGNECELRCQSVSRVRGSADPRIR